MCKGNIIHAHIRVNQERFLVGSVCKYEFRISCDILYLAVLSGFSGLLVIVLELQSLIGVCLLPEYDE